MLTIWPAHPVAAADSANNILLFSREGCTHCEDAKAYLTELSESDPTLSWEEVSVNNASGREQFTRYQELYHFPSSAPVILIDDDSTFTSASVIVGFNQPSDTGEKIKQAISGDVITVEDETCSIGESTCDIEEKISLPFVGSINLSSFSLPVVTVLIGLADGFNPCAMWALIALLGFLLSQKSRRKLVLVGGTFMIVSFAFSWFVLFGWFKAFTFAQQLTSVGFTPWWNWLEYLVLLLALFVGINLLKSGLQQKSDTCVVEDGKSNITKKISKIGSMWLPYALVAAVFLAIFVNFIELLCSLGLPVIYTKYLNDLSVSNGQAALYVTLYNIFYMLDDLIVFIGAIFLSRVVFLSPKFSRWVKIGAGVLIVGIIIWRLVQL